MTRLRALALAALVACSGGPRPMPADPLEPGAEAWEATGVRWGPQPVLAVAGSRLLSVATTDERTELVVSADRGRRWTAVSPGRVVGRGILTRTSPIAVRPGGPVVVVAERDGQVAAAVTDDGRRWRERPLGPSRFVAATSVDDRLVLIVAGPGSLAVDTEVGPGIWQRSTVGAPGLVLDAAARPVVEAIGRGTVDLAGPEATTDRLALIDSLWRWRPNACGGRCLTALEAGGLRLDPAAGALVVTGVAGPAPVPTELASPSPGRWLLEAETLDGPQRGRVWLLDSTDGRRWRSVYADRCAERAGDEVAVGQLSDLVAAGPRRVVTFTCLAGRGAVYSEAVSVVDGRASVVARAGSGRWMGPPVVAAGRVLVPVTTPRAGGGWSTMRVLDLTDAG